MTIADKEMREFAAAYEKDCGAVVDYAAKWGVHKQTVYNRMRKAGIPVRSLGESMLARLKQKGHPTLTHGRRRGEKRDKDSLYCIWVGMRRRCSVPGVSGFKYYGARGVKVHPLWEASFEEFAAYVGERPPGMSLDRIDPTGNYEPGNVRWTDSKTQARNKRSTKLTAAIVAEIRSTPKVRGTRAALAAKYGVSVEAISAIQNGKRWGEIAAAPRLVKP